MRFARLIFWLLLGVAGCASPGTEVADQRLVAADRQTLAGHTPVADNNPVANQPLAGTLSQLIELALRQNPGIQAARCEWEKQIEKYPQAVALPDPTLTYNYPLQHAATRADMEQHKLVFMQEIPFPGKLYWEGEIAKEEAHLGRLAYDRAVRDVVAEVQKSFYELAYLEAAIAITQKNRAILKQFVQAAETEVASGKTPLSDLMRAQSQTAQMDYELVRLEELRRVEVGQLLAMIGGERRQELRLMQANFPKVRAMPDLEAIQSYAVQHRQELAAVSIEIAKAKHGVSLALNDYFPDLTLGVSWAQVERDEMLPEARGTNNEWMLMVGVSLPLWLPKKNARVRESRLSAETLGAMNQDLANQLGAAVTKVYYQAANAYRLNRLYDETLLPQAHQAIALSERWYRAGEASLLAALDAQTIWLNFSLAQARARADYAQSLVAMAQLCGGTLPDAVFESQPPQPKISGK